MSKSIKALNRIETVVSFNRENKPNYYNQFIQSSTPFYEDFDLVKKDLERLEKLEKVIELCLTKYVPLDYLSPNFWESKENWLSTMSYAYYLFVCSGRRECVIKENRRLNSDEFDLIYKLLKEWLEDDK